ncbi:hypothetical protein OIU76_030258 [Salix suchowensis]|nr:hypothetical protein OIU76_030258 [Salix suchowensis]
MEMDAVPSISEIVESNEELDFESKMNEKARKHSVPKFSNRYSIEDDINRLFEAIEIRTSAKHVDEGVRDALRKKAMKRPMKVGSPQMSGIGISEPVSLKQALRGLCISQASEMAAMKRLSRPTNSSRSSEVGTIKRLYRAVGFDSEISKEELGELKSTDCSSASHVGEKLKEAGEIAPASIRVSVKTPVSEEKNQLHAASSVSVSGSSPGHKVNNSVCNSPCFMKPIFRSKNFIKKKVKQGFNFFLWQFQSK